MGRCEVNVVGDHEVNHAGQLDTFGNWSAAMDTTNSEIKRLERDPLEATEEIEKCRDEEVSQSLAHE